MTYTPSFLLIASVAALLAGCATSRPPLSDATEYGSARGKTYNFEPVELDIPAGTASDSIRLWGKATGTPYLYSPNNVEGVHTHALQARDYTDNLLRELLEGTGLTYVEPVLGAFIISKQPTTEEHR